MIRMKVKLLAYTPDPEKLVAAAAKNCYSSTDVDSVLDGLTEEKTESFVNMLSEIGHESPIEHVSFTFAIEGVSRSLLAQITRHRIASFSVQSQRYVREKGFEYVVPPEIDKIPAARAKFIQAMEDDQRTYEELTAVLMEGYLKELLEQGVPEKTARSKAEKHAIEDGERPQPEELFPPALLQSRSVGDPCACRGDVQAGIRCCADAVWSLRTGLRGRCLHRGQNVLRQGCRGARALSDAARGQVTLNQSCERNYMLPFREITLEDKPMVEHCGSHYNYHLCERCFVDLFMWRSHYNTQICFKDGFMLVKMSPLDGGHDCYLAPVGQGDLGAALDALEQDAAERGLPFVIVSVAEPMIERIEAVRPGKFTFSHDSEDGDDYIYLAEKLRTLSGKKLQSKRNLVNRFKAAYEGRWSYEDMTRENIKDAFAFHIHWCNLNGCARERDFEGETCAIVQALHNFDYLNLRGGLLRLDGEVIAFTFGCKATPDMFVVQIEKADHTIQGAYQMINQQFVQRNCNDVEYVNREEDLGLEGLRKAKKSYYPVMRGVKYVATPKG